MSVSQIPIPAGLKCSRKKQKLKKGESKALSFLLYLWQQRPYSVSSGSWTVLGGKNSPTGKWMFRKIAQGSSLQPQPDPQEQSFSGIQ